MSDFLVPASILALVVVCIAIAYVSNYIGNIGACRVMEAEKTKVKRKRGTSSN